MDKSYIKIIGNGESNLKDEFLSDYYYNQSLKYNNRNDFFSNIAKIFDDFEEILEKQMDNEIDIIEEFDIDRLQPTINNFKITNEHTNSTHWVFLSGFSYKQIQKHKKALAVAKRLSEEKNSPKPEEAQQFKYPNIFENNAFDVWEYMYNEFDIKESSRTDIKFMYEEMKSKKLIYSTVKQVDFLNWVNDTYELSIDKTSNHHRSKQRMKVFERALTFYKK